jgi:ribosomal protein L33
MIDPLISLAFAIQSNKGVYALLLGSGVSRAADIPTGWDITLDLIRKVARLKSEDCEPDPAAWYVSKTGEDPDYSKLLKALAKTAAERNQLLRSYFEPTEEEKEEGKKIPTVGHKAIADLVASGHIRVIITTNFDQLMEQALRAVGVNPVVISTPNAAEGAPPLAHTKCTIVKLHGDYLDTRIKNTPEELSKYDRRFNKLLDRIFDEYGLIICGWSGEWDTALREALERCKSRRYTTVWTSRGEPGGPAKSLIDLRRADLITIAGADEFFRDLADKVTALDEFARPHPLSIAAVIATAKKCIPDVASKVRLHDLVTRETEKLVAEMSGASFPPGDECEPDSVWQRVQRYESLSAALEAIVAAGCYWGEPEQTRLWTNVAQRVGNAGVNASGTNLYWEKLSRYPALRLLYGGGLAAIAANRYEVLRALLRGVKVSDKEAAEVLHQGEVFPPGIGKQLGALPLSARTITWLSDYLHASLRPLLKEYLPDDAQYTTAFDRFEYLRSLVCADLQIPDGEANVIGCVGRFGRKSRSVSPTIATTIGDEVAKEGKDWVPLLLFTAPFAQLKKVHDGFMTKLGWM